MGDERSWERWRSALHHLQHLAHRLGHHLLRHLAKALLLRLELRHQLREDREVGLLHLGAHTLEATVHRLHEPPVRGHDQPIDVLVGRALSHRAASIERPFRTFNGIALLVLVLAGGAQASPLPEWLHLGGRLYGLAIVDTGGGPRQRPEAVGTLDVEAAPLRALRARLELRSRAGGPFEGGPGPAVYNFNQAFQNYSPSLEFRQAYLEWRGRSAEVRAGIQTFAWGKLDGVAPTDVVNPRDWHDPLVVDEFFEEQKIGIPALLGTYFLSDLTPAGPSGVRLALAWIPWAVPARLPLALERWFPPTISGVPLNPCVRVDGIDTPDCGENQVRVHANFGTLNAGPPHTFDAGGIAAHLAGTWSGVDFELSHYTGPETGPNANLQIVAFNKGIDTLDVRADVRLAQEHSVMHMTGGAAAFPAGPFTVRAETAWFVDR